jgi:ribose transport system permease protein
MNEKLKLGLCLLAGFAAVSAVWVPAGLPFQPVQFPVWYALAALAVGLLAYTFEFSRRNLIRLTGVVVLLSGLLVALGFSNENAFGRSNAFTKLNEHGALGVIAIGAALLIITGGIDLSVGSLVGLAAVAFGVLMETGTPPPLALLAVLLFGLVAGATHGLLVTQLRLQPFLVTLCGMFIYRGMAKTASKGSTGIETVKGAWGSAAEKAKAAAVVGDAGEDARAALLGGAEKAADAEAVADAGRRAADAVGAPLLDLRFWLTGKDETTREVFPAELVVMLVLAAVAAVFLHRTAFGRYWFAIGYNPQATRYAGVNVWRHQVSVFALCSLLAALAGVMLFLYSGSVMPSNAGDQYELYAITAVVLGGVSLRGGEGTAVGVVLGAMVLPVVRTLMNFTKTPDEWVPWMIGLILLLGTVVDELIRRSKAGR